MNRIALSGCALLFRLRLLSPLLLLFFYLIGVAQVRAEEPASRWGNVPLAIEANRGQAPDAVRYLARGAGYGIFFTDSETVFALAGTAGTAVRMSVDGRNPMVHPEGAGLQAGSSHYFMNGSGKPAADAPHYSKVRYGAILPGIDLLYYGTQRQIEYDFIVSPGALPSAIRLDFSGADALSIETNGDLKLSAAGGEIRHRKPLAYQEKDGVRSTVEVRFRRLGNRRIGFDVGAYDRNLPLVIDPTVQYSTYWGGSSSEAPGELGYGIAVDAAGTVYVTGITAATNFPLVAPLQNQIGGSYDVFVLKINPEGTAVLASTYIGGSSVDEGHDIKVDSLGNIYIAGYTSSTNFPIVNGFQPTLAGSRDAYLVKLSPDAGTILYSTYIGGSAEDRAYGLAVSPDGDAYIAGMTQSRNFPVLNAMQNISAGGFSDAFVTKIAANGQLSYSTYVGGAGIDHAYDITIDSSGGAYVAGFTTSENFPRKNDNGSLTSFLGGPDDGFVVKLGPAGELVFALVIGGTNTDEAVGIAIDPDRNIYITGYTASNDFPVWKPLQLFNGGNTDIFIARIRSDGNLLDWSTYWGSTEGDGGVGIAVDNKGFVHVTGFTGSSSFPIINAVQGRLNLGTPDIARDAFLLKLPLDGSSMVYSTYLGGRSNDGALAVAVDTNGHAYLTGYTTSTEFATSTAFATTIDPLQPAIADVQDAFVLKFDSSDIIATIGTNVPLEGLASVSLGGLQRTALFGYADFSVDTGAVRPTGLELISVEQRGTTVSLLGLPVTPPILRGRLYVQPLSDQQQESIAIVNTAGTSVTISSFFTYAIADTSETSAFGTLIASASFSSGTFTLIAGGQVFVLLTDTPFFLPQGLEGTLTLQSTGPIAVTAVRAVVNSSSNLILSRIPVYDLDQVYTDPSIIDYYADGEGWKTQVTLINTTDNPMAGVIRFFGPGNGTTTSAATLTTTLGVGAEFPYSIPGGAVFKVITTGAGTAMTTGFVEVVPDGGQLTPGVFGMIQKNDTTASTLDGHFPTLNFRSYVESERNWGEPLARRAVVHMTNSSTSTLVVRLELTDSDGVYTGITADVSMPPRTEISRFLDEIPGLETAPKPFRGVLRGTVTVGNGFSVTTHVAMLAEDLTYLITATGPINEDAANAPATVFPYIPTGAQYTTRLLLFPPESGLATSGTVRTFEGGGHPLLLELADTKTNVSPFPWAPIVTAIEPPYGIVGTTRTVTFTGTNFIAGSTAIDPIADVDVTNIVVLNATTMTADFAVSAIATAGTRGVTVTTNGGSSASAPFTFIIADGPFPDLKPGRSRIGNGYVAGFIASDTISIVNIGTADTTAGYTVTSTLTTGLTYFSSAGLGWGCSATAGTQDQTVTCFNSIPIVAGGGTAPDLTLTLQVRGAALPSVRLNTTVTTDGDLITTNNTTSETVAVLAPPVPSIVLTPSTLTVGQQAAMGVTLQTGFPYQVTGTVTMRFFPTGSNRADDPSIRFENGQRQVSFTIPPFSLEATFNSNPNPGPINFQPGSVGGALVFTGQLTAGTLSLSFPNTGFAQADVPQTGPNLQSPQVTFANSRQLEIQLTISSTTRDVTLLTLNFLTTPKLHPTCGKSLGCSVNDTSITINVKPFFDAFYSANATFGGNSVLRLPLTFDVDVHGTVFVGIQNSAGFSNVVSFTLP